MHKKFLPSSVLIAIGMALAACSGGSGAADGVPTPTSSDVPPEERTSAESPNETEEMQDVQLAINFTMQPVFAPLEWGIEEGVFQRHGFNLEVTPTQGGDQAMTLLNSGNVDFALSDYDTYLVQAASDETDAEAVYVWLDTTSLALVSTEPLEGPSSLSGKKFGTTGFSAGRYLVPHIMDQNGVDPSQLTVESLDFSVLYSSLFDGEIDVAEIHQPGSWRNLQATANEQGEDVYLTHMADWGFESYEKVLFASAATLSDPDIAMRFVSAIDESLRRSVSEATDEEIFDLVRRSQPSAQAELVSADWQDFKSLLDEPGPFDHSSVERSLDRLAELGTIQNEVDAEELYNNDFVPVTGGA